MRHGWVLAGGGAIVAVAAMLCRAEEPRAATARMREGRAIPLLPHTAAAPEATVAAPASLPALRAGGEEAVADRIARLRAHPEEWPSTLRSLASMESKESALRIGWKIGAALDEGTEGSLVEVLARGADLDERRLAERLLSGRRSSRAMEAVRFAAESDPHVEVRLAAVESLAYALFRSTSSGEGLLIRQTLRRRAGTDVDPRMRESAARVLAQLPME